MEPAFLSSGCHHTETSYRESGTRSQSSVNKMTFWHSLRLFYCYCMLINNLEFQIYWQLYSDHDYKWSHVFSNSEIEVVLSSCFGQNYFFYFRREIAAKWSRMLVQTSSKGQIKRETRPDWLATKIPLFFHAGVPSPRGSVQIAYKCPTLLAPDLTVINNEFFYIARSFGGLIKPNCGTDVPK